MDQIRVDIAEGIFQVMIEYENIPAICFIYQSLGHTTTACKRIHSQERVSGKPRIKASGSHKPVNKAKAWRNKQVQSPTRKEATIPKIPDKSVTDDPVQREGKKALSWVDQCEETNSESKNFNVDALVLNVPQSGNITIQKPVASSSATDNIETQELQLTTVPSEALNDEHQVDLASADSSSIAANLQVVIPRIIPKDIGISHDRSVMDSGLRTSARIDLKKKGNNTKDPTTPNVPGKRTQKSISKR